MTKSNQSAPTYSVQLETVEAASQIFRVLGRAQEIVNRADADSLLDEMLELFVQTCAAEMGMLHLLDESEDVRLEALTGWGDATQSGSPPSRDGRLAKEVIQTRKSLVIEELRDDPRRERLPDVGNGELENCIVLPLIAGDRSLGAVSIFNYSQAPLDLLHFLANYIASEVEKSLLLSASHRREEQLEELIDVFQEISVTLDGDKILALILEKVCDLLDVEGSSLFLVDPKTDELILYLSSNLNQSQLAALRLPAGTGIIGQVAQTGETICLNDVLGDGRHYKGVDQLSGFETRSLVAVPLRVPNIVLGQDLGTTGDRIIGGIEAVNKLEGDFDERDVQLLETLAKQAATAMHIANLYTEADDLFISTISALVAAIDAKDPYTKEHSQRVATYSVKIAEEMGLPVEMQRRVKVGALLHDIGKIGVSDVILAKRDRLSDEEWDRIKTHPCVGMNIMKQVHLSEDELAALGQHHERMDGLGYPNGLKGEAISLVARIVAVADVFDALTSARPYRPAMSVAVALDILEKEAGNHLDPKCVDAFFRAQVKGEIVV